jgi:membrane carboxypeptidase/penicillin-binding protein
MIKLGQDLGITTWGDTTRFGLSLTLGGGEVTMTDLAVAYATFANGGNRVDLHPILKVTDSHGRILEDNSPPKCQMPNANCQVIDPGIAFLITDILSDNSARTPTFGPNSRLNLPGVAVKTGTTNNLRDNWTIGYTPDWLVAVWVGNNDNTPMSYVASGVTGASPIWRRISDILAKNSPSPLLIPPSSVVQIHVCPTTNTLSCPICPGRPEYFLTGTEPKISCTPEMFARLSPSPHPDRILTGLGTQR